MILIACQTCQRALRVTGDVSEVDMLVGQRSEYWPDKYACFSCGQPALGFLSPEVTTLALMALHITDVTPQEAFAALNGLGIPEERTCCIEVLEPLFQAQGIKFEARCPAQVGRVFLDTLTFPDGTKIYFGAGPQGAVIYRIVKPHSYVTAAR